MIYSPNHHYREQPVITNINNNVAMERAKLILNIETRLKLTDLPKLNLRVLRWAFKHISQTLSVNS